MMLVFVSLYFCVRAPRAALLIVIIAADVRATVAKLTVGRGFIGQLIWFDRVGSRFIPA
jgi:hypothetical protein